MSILKCLAEAAKIKAEQGPLYKKALVDIGEEIKLIKDQILEGNDMTKELQAAQQVFDIYEHRLNQRMRQTAMHADMLSKGLERFKEGVDPAATVRSFLTTSEGDVFKGANVGTSASELIRSNQRIFTGMATDLLEKLDPRRLAILRDPTKLSEIKKDMYAAMRNSGARSADSEIRAITDQIQRLTTIGGESFEKAGGNLFLRNDYMLGRSPLRDKIAAVSREEYIQDGLKAFDLQRVREATGGAIKEAGQLAHALGKDYDAILSGGIANLSEYAPPGMKSVVNSRFHRRIFHFLDADTDAAWHAKYGEDNLYARVVDYANDIGKDIGLLQALGPKPDAFIRTMLREAAGIDPEAVLKKKDVTMREFRYVTGQWDRGLDPTISKWMSTHRASQTANKLGFTVLDAITGDIISLNTWASKLRGLPVLKSIRDSLKAFVANRSDDDYRAIADLGIYTEAFIDDARTLLQRMEAEGGHRFFDAVARGVLKWTGNTRATQIHRTHKVKQVANMLADYAFDGSNKDFENWVRGSGISDATIRIAKEFGTDTHKQFGLPMISPVKLFEAGYEKEAAEIGTLFGRAVEIFSPMQSDRFKALTTSLERGSKAAQIGVGSMKGFTGYVSSFVENHLGALLHANAAPLTKASLIAGFGATMVISGTIQQMIRDTFLGKDPELNMDVIMKGVARSGFLPVVGDYIFNGGGSFGGSIAENLGGTLTSNISTALDAAGSAIRGDTVAAMKKTQRFMEQYIPGKNIWFAGLGIQRLILDQIKRLYDPNAEKAFRRQVQNLRRKGQEFWWKPGTTAPQRSPDLDILNKPFIKPKKGK